VTSYCVVNEHGHGGHDRNVTKQGVGVERRSAFPQQPECAVAERALVSKSEAWPFDRESVAVGVACRCDTRAVSSDSASRILMGVAGLIIVSVAGWGATHEHRGGMASASRSAFSGGESGMSPGARRFWAIVLVAFGACLIIGSIAV